MTTDRITVIAQLALSAVLIIGFFGALYVAWFSNSGIPADNLRIIDTMVGTLAGMTSSVIAYWFARQRNAVADK